jgi:hypothetical protein
MRPNQSKKWLPALLPCIWCLPPGAMELLAFLHK